MDGEIRGLDQIVEPMRAPLRAYVQLSRDLAGENLQGVTLYGAITQDHFPQSNQVAQSILLLGHIDLPMLRRLARHGAKLGRRHIAAPLVMTPEYIAASLDSFPLEFIEIQQFHLTVLGPDPVADLKFEAEHARLQCERELKVLQIGLRQGLLAAAGKDKMLGRLEADAARSLLRTLRGWLWLQGRKTGLSVSETTQQAEQLVGQRLPGVRAVLDENADHGWNQLVALYGDLDLLRERIEHDEMPPVDDVPGTGESEKGGALS